VIEDHMKGGIASGPTKLSAPSKTAAIFRLGQDNFLAK
jgi:hypothetical protein